MFNLEYLHRIATAAMAALVLTTVCVGAAVGPARAIEIDRTVLAATATATATGQAQA